MVYVKNYNATVHGKDCPFCKQRPSAIADYGTFFVLPNVYPYTQHHVMLMPKRHIHSINEMTYQEKIDLVEIENFLVNCYRRVFGSCFIVQREGTQGQSVYHWHRHVMPTDVWIGEVAREEYAGVVKTLQTLLQNPN